MSTQPSYTLPAAARRLRAAWLVALLAVACRTPDGLGLVEPPEQRPRVQLPAKVSAVPEEEPAHAPNGGAHVPAATEDEARPEVETLEPEPEPEPEVHANGFEVQAADEVDVTPPIVEALPDELPPLETSTAPDPTEPPTIPDLVPLALPLPIQLHHGENVVGAVIEDVLLERTGDGVVALIARVEQDGRTRRHLLAVRDLWCHSDESEPHGVRVGVKSSTLDRTAAFDLDALFDGKQPQRIAGKIIDRSRNDMQSGVLKVHDERANLVHRVFVEPWPLVVRACAGLEVGAEIVVEGMETRDNGGKLLVASALGSPGGMITVRGPRGELIWDRVTQSLRSVRAIVGDKGTKTQDGHRVDVLGAIVNRDNGAARLFVSFQGVDRAIPLGLVASAPDGGWGILLDAAQVMALGDPRPIQPGEASTATEEGGELDGEKVEVAPTGPAEDDDAGSGAEGPAPAPLTTPPAGGAEGAPTSSSPVPG